MGCCPQGPHHDPSPVAQVMDSQSHLGWKIPSISSRLSFSLTYWVLSRHHVPQCSVHTSLTRLRGWELHHFPGTPLALLCPVLQSEGSRLGNQHPSFQWEALFYSTERAKSVPISTIPYLPSLAPSSCDIFLFAFIDFPTGLPPPGSWPGQVPYHQCLTLLEMLPGASPVVGWEEGAGRHGAQAGLGVSPKHINFMLLPGAISSRMVSDAGKHPALVITFQTHPWDEGSSLYLPLQTNRT